MTSRQSYTRKGPAMHKNTALARKSEFQKFVGLDVHKETIAVAVADCGIAAPRSLGVIRNDLDELRKMLQRLGSPSSLQVCYEAGPCGYVVYHFLKRLKIECTVVAPSLIPRKPGDRIKTDRRDALALARLLRSGELTATWVPDPQTRRFATWFARVKMPSKTACGRGTGSVSFSCGRVLRRPPAFGPGQYGIDIGLIACTGKTVPRSWSSTNTGTTSKRSANGSRAWSKSSRHWPKTHRTLRRLPLCKPCAGSSSLLP
jgi:hypothetical protein